MALTHEWQKLEQQYDTANDIEESFQAKPHSRRIGSFQRKHILFVLNICLFLLSVSFITFTSRAYNKGDTCVRRLSQYSPVLQAFDDAYEQQRYHGTFDSKNIYRGQLSDELDWAWQYLGHGNSSSLFRISESDIRRAEAAPGAVKIPSSAGGGYLAGIEGMHQLHCLNLIRMYTYQDYYKMRAPEWQDSPQTLRTHVDHCIDILRQKLMCDADAGVMTFAWVKGRKLPFPNFNIEHKCRDYEKLLQWNRDHDLEFNWKDLTPTGDALIMDIEP